LRGEKFTAPINRTKTYFVNRSSGVVASAVWVRGSRLGN
jgi:hypothetical protein